MNFTKEQVLELLQPITIAKIKSVKKHENADRLLVVEIVSSSDDSQVKTVATAANNFKEGDLVPYLGVGSTVPGFLFKSGENIKLEVRNMRGVMSEGMILAEDEIGLSDDHTGILIVDKENNKLNLRKFNEEDLIGRSLVDMMTEDAINIVLKNAGVVEMTPELKRRLDIILSIGEDGGEVIGADELPAILASGEELFTYDGFEPSGQMHIAQGIIRAINTNKMIDAGFTFKMWVADWFGYLNNKMGGDLNKIKKVGEYFIEIWRASGMNLEGTEFLWTSDFVGQREYWETVMKVSKAATLKRVLKTTEIMGRNEADDLSAAQILYPAMQVTDIFKVMKCQVTQLGLDQRKVNMLAREIGPSIGFWKPVVVSHGMLRGLSAPKVDYQNYEIDLKEWEKEIVEKNDFKFEYLSTDKQYHDQALFKITNKDGKSETFSNSSCIGLPVKLLGVEISADPYPKRGPVGATFTLRVKIPVQDAAEIAISRKMSKSKPDTAIFMTDTAEDVQRKIIKAYCPEGEAEDNPILGYCKQIIFQAHFLKRSEPLLKDGKFVVERDEKFGGNVEYSSYEELEKDFVAKNLFPLDLKTATIKYLNALLQPVRDHFENDSKAKALLEEVRGFQVTR